MGTAQPSASRSMARLERSVGVPRRTATSRPDPAGLLVMDSARTWWPRPPARSTRRPPRAGHLPLVAAGVRAQTVAETRSPGGSRRRARLPELTVRAARCTTHAAGPGRAARCRGRGVDRGADPPDRTTRWWRGTSSRSWCSPDTRGHGHPATTASLPPHLRTTRRPAGRMAGPGAGWPVTPRRRRPGPPRSAAAARPAALSRRRATRWPPEPRRRPHRAGPAPASCAPARHGPAHAGPGGGADRGGAARAAGPVTVRRRSPAARQAASRQTRLAA
ncbi:hypothetical protein QJS66_10480 [Kocuria rhizophila]|nr:hypothetical protein QJS66_10480 [Kocuria rhizophila]